MALDIRTLVDAAGDVVIATADLAPFSLCPFR